MLYYSVFDLDDHLFFKIVMSFFFVIEYYNLIITEGENTGQNRNCPLKKQLRGMHKYYVAQ